VTRDPASPQAQGRLFKKLALRATTAADDKKGMDIALLHIRPVSEIADYMLVVSVTSPPHMRAIEEEIKRVMKEEGIPPRHRDGKQSEHWRVLDFGGLLVHLMHPTAREYYALDKVFHGAKSVAWETPAVPAKKAPRKKAKKAKTAARRSRG
jgi:ribosome-associated protein